MPRFCPRVLRVGNPKQCWGGRGVLGEKEPPLLSRGVPSPLNKHFVKSNIPNRVRNDIKEKEKYHVNN